jgi:DNA-directed DNA polymerase III PolC
MIIARSTFSLSSRASDRIALLDPKALAKAIAAAGHTHAVLADERSMAGALAFLAAAKEAKITGAAGLSLSDLKSEDVDYRLTFVPLNERGLHKLIAVSDELARATFCDEALNAFPLDPDNAEVDIVVLVSPHKAPQVKARCLNQAVYRARGLGCVVASLHNGHGEDIASAPQAAAEAAAILASRPYGRFLACYAKDEPSEKAKDALASVCANNTAVQSLPAFQRRPQVLKHMSMPDGTSMDHIDPVATEIASRIVQTSLKRKPSLPQTDNAADAFRKEVEEGLQRRVAAGQIKDNAATRQRIENELEVIETLGFADYFLIMREAIRFARANNIPVGPGRGSAAGSLVTYCLGITNIEPLRHGLLFERFLNPSRVSLPDIDTDFDEERRGEVIDHMANVYGDENVAQIATYGSRKTRGSIREAARVLGLRPAGEKLIGELDRIEKEEDPLGILAETVTDPEMALVVDIARTLAGTAAHQGIHAGGIIISDKKIREHAPLLPARSDIGRPVIAFDMKATEDAGFVKFDFLGLSSLSVMHKAVQLLSPIRAKNNLPPLNLDDLIDRPDDKKVFEMIKSGRTRTIFQLESGGITAAAREIAVECFDDIVALVALYRPGPMAYIPLYAARKHGTEPVEYPDPCLEPITKATYGIMIYQEQIMQMAQAFAGYTMAEADNLRRAIGKKIVSAVQAERKVFIERAMACGHSEDHASDLFKFIEPFALYGFNKSHAVAYATISYQTAWLKANYPGPWFAACLAFEDDAVARRKIIQEAERFEIKVQKPTLGVSHGTDWTVTDDGKTILMPYTAIKGIPQAAGAALQAGLNGKAIPKTLTGLLDACAGLTTNHLVALIRAGLLDGFRPDHPRVTRPILSYLAEHKLSGRSRKAADGGQNGLFDMLVMPDVSDPKPSPLEAELYRPLDLDDLARIEDEALHGAFSHHKTSETSADWIVTIEKMMTLQKAVDVARNTVTRAAAQVRHISDRIVPKPDGSSERRISLTLGDNKFEIELDLARDVRAEAIVDTMKGRSALVTLRPAPGDAFIANRPEIMAIEKPHHPLDEPRRYPVVEIDEDMSEELMQEIKMHVRRASTKGPARITRDNHKIIRASHVILIVHGAIIPMPVGTHVNETLLETLFAAMPNCQSHPATHPDDEPAALQSA